jgi:Ca2+-binding EF-hand superfamily protein
MRSVSCLLVVCMFATTAAAQFGTKGSTTRTAARPADTTQKKTTTEKGHLGKAAAGDQAAADTDLANALLAAMDIDGDGVVTKIEMNKAMAALRKVHKDAKGNMVVPDKAATDPNAATAAGADPTQGPGGVGAAATGDARNNNEAMAWFAKYDANHDGVLSANEVPAQGRAMLRGADLNGDGVLDAAEWQAFSRKMGERMKAMAAGVNPNGGGAPGDGRAPKP